MSLAPDIFQHVQRPHQAGKMWWQKIQRRGTPYMFLTPFLLVFLALYILPIAYAFGFSLFTDRLIGGTVFVGGQNYLQVLSDPAFWEGVKHMLVLGIVQVPIMLGLALFFALFLDSGIVRLRTLFRLGFFLPYAIPSVVAALLWGYLYGPSFGPFAQIAQSLHLQAPGFLTESGMLGSIGNIITWQYTGYNMVILYAALQAVPSELYDAAYVDGASSWQLARYIRVPLIRPALFLATIFSIIGTVQLFNEPQIMSVLAPNVIGDHYSPSLYAYNSAFLNQQYNYSAAISFTLGFIAFACSALFMVIVNWQNRLSSSTKGDIAHE